MNDEDRIQLLKQQLILYAEQNQQLKDAQLEVDDLGMALQETLSRLQLKVASATAKRRAPK